jgi:DNA-binding SARP family transcriptional activator
MSEEGRPGRPYPLGIELLGGFLIIARGRATCPRGVAAPQAGAVIKLLAPGPRRRLHREQAMDALPPEPGPAAPANLRKALTQLATLIKAEGGSSSIVVPAVV